jgi:uncharacterized protein (TIGR03000 family)
MLASSRFLATGMVVSAALLLAPAAQAFDLDFCPWPNVSWPSPNYFFTYGEGQGNYIVYYPGGMGKSTWITPADITWFRNTKTALVEVVLPDAEAELSVQGKALLTKGTKRRFVSPSLNPGDDYTYELTAKWDGPTKPIEQTRRVTVRAGERVAVDFTAPAPK